MQQRKISFFKNFGPSKTSDSFYFVILMKEANTNYLTKLMKF